MTADKIKKEVRPYDSFFIIVMIKHRLIPCIQEGLFMNA